MATRELGEMTWEEVRDLDPAHTVVIVPTGAIEAHVNSLHNQGIERLAAALKPEAWASDGLIEAASVIGAPTLQIGVQWHPEWHVETDPLSKQLFNAFGEACIMYRRTDRGVA